MKCQYILSKGKHKGSTCNKRCDYTFCSTHGKRGNGTSGQQNIIGDVIDIDKLYEVHSIIINKLLVQNNPKCSMVNLLQLSQVSKYWNEQVKPVWVSIYNDITIDNETKTRMESVSMLSHLQRLSLILNVGCQMCGKSRIQKIHWPFPVRMCMECFQQKMISLYRLVHEYHINKTLLEGLYYTTDHLWLRHTGSYTAYFYAILQVEKRVGATLDKYIENTLINYWKHIGIGVKNNNQC